MATEPQPADGHALDRNAAAPAHSNRPQGDRTACSRCRVPDRQSSTHARGLAWVFGAFVLCPCHLPITLAAAAALLGGTAAGTALRAHPMVAGAITTITWAAATAYGFWLMREERA